ncbi:MAG: hypothetical protein NTW29_21950 [Bacteroidetes bacterium]|nr:hypothetical protein [Bacteroidota bacterium]
MRYQFIFIVSVLVLFYSCSYLCQAYLRNLTDEVVIADVHILNPEDSSIIPKRIRTANGIAVLKKDFITGFSHTSEIRRLDNLHYQVLIRPGSTINLSDITGAFMNGAPISNQRVVLISSKGTDTLMNGWGRRRNVKFHYIGGGLIVPGSVIYYDCVK